MSTETQRKFVGEWITERKFAYLLHETGRFKNGIPELCNKFYFSIEPDYAHGITEEDAAKELGKIMTAVNSHQLLLDALKELYDFTLNGEGKYLDIILNHAEAAIKAAENKQ